MQCPLDSKQITFLKEGRSHGVVASSESNVNRVRKESDADRTIFNFILSDEKYSDRARVVLNESAKQDYEIERDASKFMSSNAAVPQIYVIDNGVHYAIDERPLGTGEYALGVRIGKEGSYTISMRPIDSDYEVVLVDKETDTDTNLNEDSYTFSSDVRTLNDRFAIKVSPKNVQSSIENMGSDRVGFSVNGNKLVVDCNAEISLYSVDGRLIYDGVVDGALELSSGIYILSIDGASCKIAVK